MRRGTMRDSMAASKVSTGRWHTSLSTIILPEHYRLGPSLSVLPGLEIAAASIAGTQRGRGYVELDG